jgi:hypothetical protein
MGIHRRHSLGLVTAAVVAATALASSLIISIPAAAAASPPPLPVPRVGPGPGSTALPQGTAIPTPTATPAPGTRTGTSQRFGTVIGSSNPWSIVGSGDTSYSRGPSSSGGDVLADVTCVSSSDCWAVGYYYNGTVDQALIEQDTGSGWLVVPTPNTSTTLNSELNAVACLNAGNCWAVGESAAGGVEQPLIEQDTGTGWSIITSRGANTGENYYISGIDCTNSPSATGVPPLSASCVAVGYVETASANQTVVEADGWLSSPATGQGEGWAFTGSSDTSSTVNNDLYSVTCLTVADCWAVGASASGTGGYGQNLVEQYNGNASGSWSIVPSPSTSSSQGNELDGVACVSASDCWAVGGADTGTGGDVQNLVEQYNGSAWSIVGSPDTSSSQPNALLGVACPSASDCRAVGLYVNGSAGQTLAEQYNGSSWSIVSSPDVSSARDNELLAVACASTSDCRAVGIFANGTAYSVLVEQTAVTQEASLVTGSLGSVVGSLHPVSWGPGNQEVFWRGSDNNLYQEYSINGNWYGPDQLTTSGNLASDPEPISWGVGNLEVFWRGSDGNLWQMYYLNGWQGPASLGDGPLGTATPMPVSWGPGNIEVFWEGTDQNIWEAYYANGWHGPQGLGDGPLGAGNTPQPVSWGVGNIELFWEGTDQNLWEAYYANGWQGPVGLGDGPLGTGATLTPVSWGTGNLEVFWKGTDQNLWQAYYANGWHGPQGLGGGPLGSAPHPVASASGVLDVFWSGTDGGLWHIWYANGWSGPATFGGVPMGDAALVAPPQPLTGAQTNPAEVFWVGPFGTLWFASSNS